MLNKVYQNYQFEQTFTSSFIPGDMFTGFSKFAMDVIDWLQGKVEFYTDLANEQFLAFNKQGAEFYLDVAFQYDELITQVGQMSNIELLLWATTDYQQIN